MPCLLVRLLSQTGQKLLTKENPTSYSRVIHITVFVDNGKSTHIQKAGRERIRRLIDFQQVIEQHVDIDREGIIWDTARSASLPCRERTTLVCLCCTTCSKFWFQQAIHSQACQY